MLPVKPFWNGLRGPPSKIQEKAQARRHVIKSPELLENVPTKSNELGGNPAVLQSLLKRERAEGERERRYRIKGKQNVGNPRFRWSSSNPTKDQRGGKNA